MRSEGSRSVERMTGDGRYAEPERRFVSPRRDRRRVDLPEPTDEKAHQKLAPSTEMAMNSPGPRTMLSWPSGKARSTSRSRKTEASSRA